MNLCIRVFGRELLSVEIGDHPAATRSTVEYQGVMPNGAPECVLTNNDGHHEIAPQRDFDSLPVYGFKPRGDR